MLMLQKEDHGATEGRKPNCTAGRGVVSEGFLEEVANFR